MHPTRRWLGLVLLLGLAAPAVWSADQAPPSAAEARQEAQAKDVELLADAYRLAEFAETHKAPEAYVAAGSLIRKLKALTKGQIDQLDAKPEVLDENDKPVKGAKVETQKSESLDDIAQGFFDSASALGLELKLGPEVEALMKAAKARNYDRGARGAVGGPKWFTRALGPKQKHVYTIAFDTLTIASVGFQSSATTRCKMQIGGYTHFNQVVRVGNYTWKPKEDRGPVKIYTITVHNPHNSPVVYKLFTNCKRIP